MTRIPALAIPQTAFGRMRRHPFALVRFALVGACVAIATAVAPVSPCARLHAQSAASTPAPTGARAVPDVSDLPLVEVPARRSGGTTLAIFLSGDGGWADIDRQIADVLADHGVGVVGLNSRAYLSQRKSPDQAAADVARIARAYAARWGTRRLVVIGYSRGAGMVPFVATRFAADLRQRTVLLAMLGLERTANFQFHWMDVMRDASRPDDLAVAPELERLRGQRMLCVFGTEEKDSACRDADPALITRIARQGDHHFDGDYRALGDLILGLLPPGSP